MITPVILSGGSGSRLWPLSRAQSPKQFIALEEKHSLLQSSVLRFSNHQDFHNPVLVCAEKHRFLMAQQLAELEVDLKKAAIILEPCARNTTAAILLAALYIAQSDPQGLMLVVPSDQYLENSADFYAYLETAVAAASQDLLVTFGIKPKAAHTGYGYIQTGEKNPVGFYDVKAFVEKPNLSKARAFVASGQHFINSGMFVFKAQTFLQACIDLEPELYHCVKQAFSHAKEDLDFIRIDPAHFEKAGNVSVDYAIMERSKNIAMVPLDMVWNDIGSWSSLYEIAKKDTQGNVIKGDVCIEDVENCYIHATDRVLTAVGVRDLMMVETGDAVLVAHQDHAQAIKHLVENLQDKHPHVLKQHKRVYRPWGYYENLALGGGFRVRYVCMSPGEKILLQSHQYHRKSWNILSGIASIHLENKIENYHQEQSLSIDPGVKHQVCNESTEDLIMLEFYFGPGEGDDEDIMRYDAR